MKWNRLAQSSLNHMVYVMYNRALRRRYNRKDTTDPILLGEIDDSNERLLGIMDENLNEEEDEEFGVDDLTVGLVSRDLGLMSQLMSLEDQE